MNRKENVEMEKLFSRWVSTYPQGCRQGFHRDGIINEEVYKKERIKLLFVMLEPNSSEGYYNHFYGKDLREVYGEITPVKNLTRNVSLWVRAILDSNMHYEILTKSNICEQLKRVAIINLKKISGTGTANLELISILSWRDKEYIKKQVELISPDIIVTCGEAANKLFHMVATEDVFKKANDSIWDFGAVKVLPANHPSLRPKDAEKALERIFILGNQLKELC